MIANHLPVTIRVAESRVTWSRSSPLPRRSPAIPPRPRSGTITAIVATAAVQKNNANARWSPGPSAPASTNTENSRNRAPWRSTNVRKKIPDCTPWRSSLTSIGGSQAGKSSPGHADACIENREFDSPIAMPRTAPLQNFSRRPPATRT